MLNLASFLGEQLHNLHLLTVPRPSTNETIPTVIEDNIQPSLGNGFSRKDTDHPADMKLYISILNRKRKDVSRRLTEWYGFFSVKRFPGSRDSVNMLQTWCFFFLFISMTCDCARLPMPVLSDIIS